jgi:mono/diheme cytochrome c family protein
MADGAGVPGMQAPLAESRVVAGAPEALIRLLLEGPRAALAAERAGQVGEMPPFPQLSDDEIAAVLTHVRQAFGHAPSPSVASAQVAALRTRSSR